MTALPVRIVAIGDELLEGRTSDTNSTRIQRALFPHAVEVKDIAVVPDLEKVIATALDRTEPGDVVFICGGLGSTRDDLTRESIAAWAGVQLQFQEDLAAELDERRRRHGYKRSVEGDKQALVPVGMMPVINPVGSAPGLVGTLKQRRLAVLPGVPSEVEGLLPGVLAALEELGALPPARETRLWRTAQMGELAVARLTEPIRERFPLLHWSWWIVEWGVDVRVGCDQGQEDDLRMAADEVDGALGNLCYSNEMVDLPHVVQELMVSRGLKLAVAESCTGGLLGTAITSQDGSSAYHLGGILSYANEVKTSLLDVDPRDLEECGAVSRPVAERMAQGVRTRLGADYSLSVTGIAGPAGGTEEKPVGTTWIALAGPEGVHAGRFRFGARRAMNRQLAVSAALDILRRALQGHELFDPERLTWGQEG